MRGGELKSNIISEGSRHLNFMNPFEYGQSFIGQSFPNIAKGTADLRVEFIFPK